VFALRGPADTRNRCRRSHLLGPLGQKSEAVLMMLAHVQPDPTHRSIAAIACAWFRRNVFQLCEGGLPPRTMYLETVDWATAKPSIRSSPWIRDAPHSGFSLLIR